MKGEFTEGGPIEPGGFMRAEDFDRLLSGMGCGCCVPAYARPVVARIKAEQEVLISKYGAELVRIASKAAQSSPHSIQQLLEWSRGDKKYFET